MFWKVNGTDLKFCSKAQVSDASDPPCTNGKMDDPAKRTADDFYLVDDANSGFEKYSPTSRALASTLTISGIGVWGPGYGIIVFVESNL